VGVGLLLLGSGAEVRKPFFIEPQPEARREDVEASKPQGTVF